MDFLLLLVAFALAVVMIVAQCQLFAIRQLLEQLVTRTPIVRLEGSAPVAVEHASGPEDSPPEGRVAYPQPKPGSSAAPIIAMVVILLIVVIVLAAAALPR